MLQLRIPMDGTEHLQPQWNAVRPVDRKGQQKRPPAMSHRPEPHQRTDYAYFQDITTRWMDNDVYRHVNNVVYYSYFDTVVNQYLMLKGVLDIEQSQVVGLVVETTCRYFSPIAFPSIVHAGLRVAHIGNSSVRYEVGLFRDDDTIAAAQGHFIHVYVDRVTNRPVPLPPELRAALAPLMRPTAAGGRD